MHRTRHNKIPFLGRRLNAKCPRKINSNKQDLRMRIYRRMHGCMTVRLVIWWRQSEDSSSDGLFAPLLSYQYLNANANRWVYLIYLCKDRRSISYVARFYCKLKLTQSASLKMIVIFHSVALPGSYHWHRLSINTWTWLILMNRIGRWAFCSISLTVLAHANSLQNRFGSSLKLDLANPWNRFLSVLSSLPCLLWSCVPEIQEGSGWFVSTLLLQ